MIRRLDKVCKELDEFFEELIVEHTDLSRISSGNPNILDLLILLKEDNSCSIHLAWDHVKAVLMQKIPTTGKAPRVIPFGAGRRGCPGIPMGLAMVELILANLVYSFDWELPLDISSREDIDVEGLPGAGITMNKKNPLYLVPINTHLHHL
ncbi:hypothetical protein ACS0TY_016537 [Phlomoides rotata]